MYLYLFLTFAFLGAATGAPIDKCQKEYKEMETCFDRIDIWLWEEKGFSRRFYSDIGRVLECIEEPTCEYNKLALEMGKMRMNLTKFMAENLVGCLGNGTMDKFFTECNFDSGNNSTCDDKKPLKCVLKKMRNHETCNSKDVEAFQSTFATFVRLCVVWKEMEELNFNPFNTSVQITSLKMTL